MTNTYQAKSSYQYHAPSVAGSTHSLERETQRLGHLNKEQQAQVAERAVEMADKFTDNHFGVKVFVHQGGDVWAVVSGRTVRTIITTKHGTHLDKTSPCNKYATHPQAVLAGRRF